MPVSTGKLPIKVGDRVTCCVKLDRYGEIRFGEEGTVVDIVSKDGRLGIKWDLSSEKRRDCLGSCSDDYGWWVWEDEVTVINNNGQLELFP